MTIHHHARRLLRPVAFTAGVAVLGAMALSSQAASPAPWRALFPVAAAYPHGTHLLRMQSATRPSALVDAVTAMQVTHLGFVVGGIQDAVLPHQAVASVTVLVFRTERGAATFVREDHPTALANPNTPGTAVDGLGDGARYISGACAACGTGATPGYPDPVPWHGRGADPDPAAGPRSGPTPGSHRPAPVTRMSRRVGGAYNGERRVQDAKRGRGAAPRHDDDRVTVSRRLPLGNGDRGAAAPRPRGGRATAPLTKIAVETPAQAVATRFLGSPTVRVNGRDIEPARVDEPGGAMSCRIYQTEDGGSGVPPAALIRAAVRCLPRAGTHRRPVISRASAGAATSGDDPMTAPPVEAIGQALAASLWRDDDTRAFYRQLLRLLADGQPVSRERLATALGAPRKAVDATLRQYANVEEDDQGNIVASGISLRPHSPPVSGQRARALYLVCARHAPVSRGAPADSPGQLTLPRQWCHRAAHRDAGAHRGARPCRRPGLGRSSPTRPHATMRGAPSAGTCISSPVLTRGPRGVPRIPRPCCLSVEEAYTVARLLARTRYRTGSSSYDGDTQS